MENAFLKTKKTDNVIEVLLGNQPGTLEINDHEVFQNSLKQVITWKLAKALQSGDFTSFAWVDPSNASGTFDTPEISPDGNALTIGDHNGPAGKKGHLAYIITIELGGVSYSSRTSATQQMIKDPVIINR
ncbi:MAG: hypothetical protein ABIP16_00730 [Thermomonas sp.]